MAAGLEGVFYLDDPADGASAAVLREAGVAIRRAARAPGVAGGGTQLPLGADAAVAAEHTYSGDVVLHVQGGAYVDVRDGADAWVRVVVNAGDDVDVRAGAKVRVRRADCVKQPYESPVTDTSDRASRVSTVRTLCAPLRELAALPPHTPFVVVEGGADAGAPTPVPRVFASRRDAEEAELPYFTRPGTPHVRDVVVDLCASFYTLGWVTGTGGSISIRHGGRTFMAPSGVQKERMQAQDIFVLDPEGQELYAPLPLAGKPRLKLSQCAPLFHHAFTLRGAGACIHTHDVNAVMVTLLAGSATEFRITHQEMIKGIAGHGFTDTCVVPIIENTPHECDLADSLGEAMRRYPRSNAVLVRRHGVYVWGASWEAAKTQAECYHYLFEAAVRMRDIGLDPAQVPRRVEEGIGAGRAYGSGRENAGGHGSARADTAAALAHVHEHTGSSCCGGAGDAAVAAAATSDGFHGSAGTAALPVAFAAAAPPAAPRALPPASSYSHVVLDVEGCTTSIQFVTEVLFPYAAAHVEAWLAANWGGAEARADVAALVAQSADDVARGVEGAAAVAVPASVADAAEGAPRAAALAAVLANVRWQMGANRKTGALKGLQGHVWRAGYESGVLKGHVFDDTPRALQAWVAAGKRVYIYSSGSREAQRLLFAHSAGGDLRAHLSGYFDTRVGPKVEAASYADIVLSLGVDAPGAVLFATDAPAEAVAAAAAGMQVVLTVRPGNAPLPAGHPFPEATDLMAVARA